MYNFSDQMLEFFRSSAQVDESGRSTISQPNHSGSLNVLRTTFRTLRQALTASLASAFVAVFQE
jgi:hypothetical protein